MIDAVDVDAASGIDVCLRLLVRPVNHDAGSGCARRREGRDAAES